MQKQFYFFTGQWKPATVQFFQSGKNHAVTDRKYKYFTKYSNKSKERKIETILDAYVIDKVCPKLSKSIKCFLQNN